MTEMHEALRSLVIEIQQIPVDWKVDYAKEQAEKSMKAVDVARAALRKADGK